MPRLNAKRIFFFFLLTTILTLSYTNAVQCEDSQMEAEQAITAAENRINEVFTSVRTAEEAGAKVEDLIDKLNTALNLTLKAHTQLLSGNFSGAITLSSNAIEMADEVENQADARKQEALSTVFLQKYGTVIVFVITDAIICVVGVFLIHKWQHRSLMKKKPELAVKV